MSTIVVGYDGTEGADVALCEAASLARDLGDRLVLVFSYEVSRLGGEVADYADALRQYGRGVLERGRSQDVLHGLDVELREVEQRPAHGLIAIADEYDARMIVTGSYGERPLKGILVGSTPYRLMHLSERPVLVVRSGGQDGS
ncbi:universal stress protein [Capillimicrobium parvum]|uniref:UspA domain-containing protein n=1 Tax=Capillimicrobium parvum TaxID=2884022 RepID=A0A9E6XXB9_9ACTN|nr:universal stress protein [Capillimicrobium parvum]UGS36272.1 hypothetical protein DSM104329_02673 [Capillimicrobium parvum]